MYKPTLTCPHCGETMPAGDYLEHEKTCSKSPTITRYGLGEVTPKGEKVLERWLEHEHQREIVPGRKRTLGGYTEPTEAEVQQEMREHPWADREIAERIAKDHIGKVDSQIVYVLLLGNINDPNAWSVEKVFSTQEKAEAYRQEYIREASDWWSPSWVMPLEAHRIK